LEQKNQQMASERKREQEELESLREEVLKKLKEKDAELDAVRLENNKLKYGDSGECVIQNSINF
jgi:nitric oxide reductase activation protein